MVIVKEKELLPVNVNVTLEGRKSIIKPISRNEINEKYLSWLSDSEVNQYLDVRYESHTFNDIIDHINELRSKSGCELFAVFSKDNNVHVGNIAINAHNPNGQGYADYGIMIGDEKARKMGLGGEANVLLIEYIFRNPQIRRIRVGMYSDNDQSWKIFETLGFIREAVMRQHAVLESGKICDAYIYGLLRKEWELSRKKVDILLKDMRVIDLS